MASSLRACTMHLSRNASQVPVTEKQNQPLHRASNSALPAVSDRQEAAIHLALLVALGLLLCAPVLIHGAPDLSHDGVYHAVWAKQFATQFWQGDFYPRWFSNINGGFGGPSGFFYPPINNYVASLFWPFMAARDPEGWLAAGYAMVLAEILSGIAAYLWLRSLTKPRAALLGAVAYVIAPYHLAIDLYQRCASAEFWIFVWLPLVLLSAEGLLRRSRWAVPGAALSYALAVLSHPTVALCFAPIAVAYVFCFSESKERLRSSGKFVALLLLGVSLDAVYLLPAMLDQDKAYISLQTIAGGWGDYHNRWLWQDRAGTLPDGQVSLRRRGAKAGPSSLGPPLQSAESVGHAVDAGGHRGVVSRGSSVRAVGPAASHGSVLAGGRAPQFLLYDQTE